MHAAILAVGSEMLGSRRLDTNSLKLTAALDRHGVPLVGKAVVGDDEERIAAELRWRLERAELVLVTGGLGPTTDDLTRAAVARALGRDVRVDEEVVAHIRALFAGFGREMPEVNRRQAEVIDGARVLENRWGTAPGMRIDEGGRAIFLFPGVPRELEKMIEHYLEPWLAERADGDHGSEQGVVKVACLAESAVEERIAPAYETLGRENVAVLAAPGEITVYLTARGTAEERRARLREMQGEIRRLVGDAAFTDRAEETLEDVVGALLLAAGRTLTTAESCTGGLVAERVTRVPGSSGWFLGGVVTYTNALKTRLLGVPEPLFADRGAVSEEVARAMATGVRSRYGSDYGIGVTGIAGPGGGSDEKPVGTVHLALAGPGEDDVAHRLVRFPGDRARVRRQTAQLALELLRRDLLARTGPARSER